MKLVLNALLILFSLITFSQSKVDSLLLTKTEWINTDLDYLRFDVDTITYNLAGTRHDLYFKLGKNTLTFIEKYKVRGVEKKKEEVKFKIKKLDRNRLVIYPLDDKVNLAKKNFKKLNYKPFFLKKEYVFYNRKYLISKVNFKKITFIASTCFGTCPSFSLEINQDGTVFYRGRIYTKKFTGNFEAVLSKEELYKLQKIMNRSQLHNMAAKWSQNRKLVDTPRYNYIVELTNGEVLEVSTNDQHPILDILSNYLVNIPKVAELKKSTKKHSFKKPKVNAYKIVGIE